ncbi:hypothetical protein NDU88_002909 [Pleurodeles waltl]|uniref:Uncharacterized protein n=1 Tax=Pleurodeles waltl TaxID=8319 RepID=A0AAV7W4I8_PLEWA|nr:hypothetical protein NDU88_002909 [Pleurodeles waltl]
MPGSPWTPGGAAAYRVGTCGREGSAGDLRLRSGRRARADRGVRSGIPSWAPGIHASRSIVELHSSWRHSSSHDVKGEGSLPLEACSSEVDYRGTGARKTPPLA